MRAGVFNPGNNRGRERIQSLSAESTEAKVVPIPYSPNQRPAQTPRAASQWQELNPVPHFFKSHQRRDQDKILDRAAYGYP